MCLSRVRASNLLSMELRIKPELPQQAQGTLGGQCVGSTLIWIPCWYPVSVIHTAVKNGSLPCSAAIPKLISLSTSQDGHHRRESLGFTAVPSCSKNHFSKNWKQPKTFSLISHWFKCNLSKHSFVKSAWSFVLSQTSLLRLETSRFYSVRVKECCRMHHLPLSP